MNPTFHAHLPKLAKATAIPKPKKTPQLAAKLVKMLGGKSRIMANAPDPRNMSTPRPDRAALESMQMGGLGYVGRQPVIGVANDPNPYNFS